jgi:hypothetical protein
MSGENRALTLTPELEKAKVPWLLVALSTVAMCFVGILWLEMLTTTFDNWYSLGSVGCMLLLALPPYLFVGLLALLGRFSNKVNRTMMTLLYATGFALTQSVSNAVGFPVGNFQSFLADRITNSQPASYMPYFVMPTVEVASQTLRGGVPVPWGDWIPVLLWWWGLWAVGALFYMALSAILRRLIVDVEAVPFPQTLIVNDVVRRTAPDKARLKLGRPFLVGFILGVVFQFPLFMTSLFPWFPDIYGWRVNMCGPGAQWLTPDSPLAGFVGFSMFNKNPTLACILYLAPLSILQSTMIFTVLFWIMTQVAYTLGYYSGIMTTPGCGRVWCGTSVSYRFGPPFKWVAFTSGGVAYGIVFFYLLLNWRYIAETIKAAAGRLDKDRLAAIETNEPLRYRSAYTLLAISFVIMIAMWLGYGIGIAPALVLTLTAFVFTLAQTRVYSLVGYITPGGSELGWGPMKLVMGEGTTPPTGEWVRSAAYVFFTGQAAYPSGWGFPFVSSLSSYKMGKLNDVSNRSIFQIVLFVSILAPLVAGATTIWSLYYFGADKLPTAFASVGGGGELTSRALPANQVNKPAVSPWEWHSLAGFLAAGALMYLHARFLWFPIEPIGLVLATDGHALIEGIWTMVLVAWVAKLLTVRVGGSKLYEEKGIPVVAGFISGFMLITFFGGLILVIRFFVPF